MTGLGSPLQLGLDQIYNGNTHSGWTSPKGTWSKYTPLGWTKLTPGLSHWDVQTFAWGGPNSLELAPGLRPT